MKRTAVNILTLFIVLFLNSCICRYPVTSSKYVLNNNSEHLITIYTYKSDTISNTIILSTGDTKEYSFAEESSFNSLLLSWGDSLLVTFDDTISIKHYRTNEQVSQRPLFFRESWTGGLVNEHKEHYNYIFTESDYQEALEYHNTNKNL